MIKKWMHCKWEHMFFLHKLLCYLHSSKLASITTYCLDLSVNMPPRDVEWIMNHLQRPTHNVAVSTWVLYETLFLECHVCREGRREKATDTILTRFKNWCYKADTKEKRIRSQNNYNKIWEEPQRKISIWPSLMKIFFIVYLFIYLFIWYASLGISPFHSLLKSTFKK